MFAACLPFGPALTSKETRWLSFSDLKPSERISEKCANRSSPPESDVMKPKPLASLNHLTIPVSIFQFPSTFIKMGTLPSSRTSVPLRPRQSISEGLHNQ